MKRGSYVRFLNCSRMRVKLTFCIEMEDYSEYESVESASEEPPEPSSTQKAKKSTTTKEVKPKVKKEEVTVKKEEAPATLFRKGSFKESAAPKPKPKTVATSKGNKKTLDSFFGKK